MQEKLGETLASMDEKIAKIIELDITRLGVLGTPGNVPDNQDIHQITTRWMELGTALKTLADGLESYHRVSKAIQREELDP